MGVEYEAVHETAEPEQVLAAGALLELSEQPAMSAAPQELPVDHPNIDPKDLGGVILRCPYFSDLAKANPELAQERAQQALASLQETAALRASGLDEQAVRSHTIAAMRDRYRQKAAANRPAATPAAVPERAPSPEQPVDTGTHIERPGAPAIVVAQSKEQIQEQILAELAEHEADKHKVGKREAIPLEPKSKLEPTLKPEPVPEPVKMSGTAEPHAQSIKPAPRPHRNRAAAHAPADHAPQAPPEPPLAMPAITAQESEHGKFTLPHKASLPTVFTWRPKRAVPETPDITQYSTVTPQTLEQPVASDAEISEAVFEVLAVPAPVEASVTSTTAAETIVPADSASWAEAALSAATGATTGDVEVSQAAINMGIPAAEMPEISEISDKPAETRRTEAVIAATDPTELPKEQHIMEKSARASAAKAAAPIVVDLEHDGTHEAKLQSTTVASTLADFGRAIEQLVGSFVVQCALIL